MTRLLTIEDRFSLAEAIDNDYTLDAKDRLRLWRALASLADGSALPEDHTDIGDGRTNAEIVAVALSYYFE